MATTDVGQRATKNGGQRATTSGGDDGDYAENGDDNAFLTVMMMMTRTMTTMTMTMTVMTTMTASMGHRPGAQLWPITLPTQGPKAWAQFRGRLVAPNTNTHA